MPRNHPKQPCSHPDCRAWAMRGGTLCSAHGGHVRSSARLPAEILNAPEPRPEDERLPTLESEIRLLAARRDYVDKMLRRRMKKEDFEPGEVLRYLAVLSQVGKSLSLMLVQRAATGGAAEIERFFEAVAQRVQELEPGERGTG